MNSDGLNVPHGGNNKRSRFGSLRKLDYASPFDGGDCGDVKGARGPHVWSGRIPESLLQAFESSEKHHFRKDYIPQDTWLPDKRFPKNP